VQFLNIDLLLTGRVDRGPLLRAATGSVFVLHEGMFAGRKALVLEVSAPGLDLSHTLSRLLRWVQELPPTARRSWNAASRRVFDIGIQAGLEPHETHWTIPPTHVAALAKVKAEIVLTVYGSEHSASLMSPGTRAVGRDRRASMGQASAKPQEPRRTPATSRRKRRPTH
jgi:hypothetical protein